ncbi:hypothetical protein PsYK624_048980 [Phanerochaete sordida]|uniref:Uncharacterized protein n=1 Tax=Phanerochaete sordida TaxID=48140 RepID=A0A9P3LAU7_9APHY|nr:hypothetical protein PsYK624_048980 [Phanerochaete sordida]
MELCTPGAQAANSPIYKRQTTRKSSKTRLVDTHFVAPPDAPPVPSLVVTPAPPSRRADSANSNSGSGARLVASLKNLTIDTPTELNGGRSYPNAQYLTVDRSYGDASGRSWVNTRAGRVSRAGSIEPRRALSLSSVPPSPASQYSQYSDGKELVLGEDSPVLVPERHTIDSVGFDRLLSASPRDTTGHFNINEATESPVSPVPPVSPKTYLSPPPSSFRTGHFSRSASGTSSRLGPNFRASAWQGSEPKDIWQTVRALRNDDQDEADPNDKLLNRSTLYSEY